MLNRLQQKCVIQTTQPKVPKFYELATAQAAKRCLEDDMQVSVGKVSAITPCNKKKKRILKGTRSSQKVSAAKASAITPCKKKKRIFKCDL